MGSEAQYYNSEISEYDWPWEDAYYATTIDYIEYNSALLSPAEFDEMYALDVRGVFNCTYLPTCDFGACPGPDEVHPLSCI